MHARMNACMRLCMHALNAAVYSRGGARARALRGALPPPACQHTSAYVSIRQHTSAYVSIRQHPQYHCAAHGQAVYRGLVSSVQRFS